MSIQQPVTVVLANRPRLFRELLHHALNTASPRLEVVEAADAMPSSSVLRDADWLIVDEETTSQAAKLASSNRHLGILALDSRGSRARLISPIGEAAKHTFSEAPTLNELFDLLSQGVAQQAS